ncbi:hypothetical protein RND81_06G033800 [Saponaria officinalis]|uniref:Protein kinase domain-containing protein n=1 Tax=Saponaria officinalis TaxID=3572 RepID=A0AAW1K3Z6_SAPOF
MEWNRGEIIGRGSFGTVNLATLIKSNPSQTSSVVVKSSHISNSGSLKNEREILGSLGNEHGNIIKYLGDCVSEEKDIEFYNIFLEYASKGSLGDYLRKSGGIFGISQVRRYTKEILSGLCHVHEKGFVHCDVKLQNILVFDGDLVKLADFGLSKRVEENEGGFGCQLKGTPLYMSPEIVAGGEVTRAADVWAVGCAVVEMVTGFPVWECLPENDVTGLFYRIGVRGECPRIPVSLCDEGKDFLRKCFLKDPNERWTARMLLDHPFISGFNEPELLEKASVSPKCPFEFPDWESTECLSFGSSSVVSFDLSESIPEETDVLCWRSISYRFEEELVSTNNQVPNWSESNGWVTVR